MTQDNPSPATPSLGRAVPTPSAPAPGLDEARPEPRSRRGDYLLTAAIGAVLAPSTLALTGMTAQAAAAGNLPRIAGFALLTLAVSALAQWVFAARSSLGGLVGGLVALAAQTVILLSPGRADAAPFTWARSLIPTGAVLIVAALLLGGSWGMRRARSAGRADARLSIRLGEQDKTPGVTPAAPPSRRRDHVLSLPITIVAAGSALALIAAGYARLVSPGTPLSGGLLGSAAALILLLLGTAFTGRSTLGARTTGTMLVLLSLPGLLTHIWPHLPGHALLLRLLPNDPTGVSLLLAGTVLVTVGWGAHLARREGRIRELTELRSRETPTPPHGLPRA
ncbi:hypothetical protein [Actinomyces procaprae]|uniref:hypothetical protein n=1 Tax=Actinomyces procaprae TaxID=2560010 RepID=UPI001FFB0145|nr:hypothetical protein [Actinomyces procaprae]